jgi:hypothetical protein
MSRKVAKSIIIEISSLVLTLIIHIAIMRLIQASSIAFPDRLAFKDFPVSQLPPYAILSHTWGNDEVVWADFERGTAHLKPSFGKVTSSCLRAIEDGLEWVWIDSACIDKSSSAELSESINSMYDWYRRAEICYAHLEGVSSTADVTQTSGEFAGCKWFTRGWTLQELLAPAEIAFYSDDWVKIGDKAALCRPLSVITGMDEDILTGAKALESASIAKRMSWAAQRHTTRPEDVAYCLMGIFGVNMPMLYGEGDKAFLRLQEEIMKQSDDQSIFAWANMSLSADAYHGLLAKSPADFTHSHSVMPYQDWEPRPPYQLTNRGLRIDLPLTIRQEGTNTVFIAALDCPAPPDYEDGSFLGIYLKKLSHGDQQYTRIRVGQFAKIRERGRRQTIYVKQNNIVIADIETIFPHHVFQLRMGPSRLVYTPMRVIVDPTRTGQGPDVISSSRSQVRRWMAESQPVSFVGPKVPGELVCAIMFERVDDGERVLMLLGSSDGMRVGYQAMELPPVSVFEGTDEGDVDYSFAALQTIFRPSNMVRLGYNQLNVNVDTLIVGATKYHLIDIQLEKTGEPEYIEEVIAQAAKSAYDKAVGRENKTEMANIEHAEMKAKKPSIWKRMMSQ